MKYNSSDYFDPLPERINHFTPSRIISYFLLGIFVIFCVVGLWIYFLGPTSVIKNINPSTIGKRADFPGKIAFIRDFNVWIKIDGKEKQITKDAVYSYKKSRPVYTLTYAYPVISPDGKKVAYFQTKSHISKLYVYNLTTKKAQMVSSSDSFETSYPILWLKDSSRMYIETYRGGEHHLVELNSSNGDQTVLAKYSYPTGCGTFLSDPARLLGGLDNALPIYTKIFQLSRDGKYILHNATCSGYGVGLYDLKQKKDTIMDYEITQAVFSPDSSKIVGITKQSTILVYDTKTAKIINTLNASFQPQMLFWASDNSMLYYTASEKVPKQPALGTVYKASLLSMTLDGKKEKNLTDFDANAIRPIAFSTDKFAMYISVIENPTKFYTAMNNNPAGDLSGVYPNVSLMKFNLITHKKNTVISKALEASYL
jgi:WD40 repeat protein